MAEPLSDKEAAALYTKFWNEVGKEQGAPAPQAVAADPKQREWVYAMLSSRVFDTETK